MYWFCILFPVFEYEYLWYSKISMYRKFFFGIGVLFFMLLPVFLFAQTTANFTSCNSDISEGCYTLLEPLGEIEGIQVGGNEEQYQGIGGFINFVFEIGIGIGGVLGVVMLVIYGFQYATNEQSVAKFSEIQKRVTQVLLGLILLLGTFILLRTINPDLLLIDPRISGVGFELDVERELDPGDSVSDSNIGSFVNSATSSCPEGVTKIQGIFICKKKTKDLERLLNDAKNDNLNISGGGFRTRKRQEELRNNNCRCNNNLDCIYKTPARQCTPETAIPGRSRHESGLAIDFTCDGQTIRARDNKCFLWLKDNASKYGFFNLPSEPWHWSVDGK